MSKPIIPEPINQMKPKTTGQPLMASDIKKVFSEYGLQKTAEQISKDISKIELCAVDDADFRSQVVDYFTKPNISPFALPSQAYDEYFALPEMNKETEASVCLDGETMDCTKCQLGKDYRKQLLKEIEKEVEPCHEGYKNVLCIPKRWWQQFKGRIE